MPRTRRPYPPEFREQLVALVRAGRTPEDLAGEFEPTAQSISNWVAQADRDAGRRTDGLTTAERTELTRLRRENRQLKVERDILSKAAAWFAQETAPNTKRSSGESESGHLSGSGDEPAAGRLRQRILCLAAAAPVGAGRGGYRADGPHPCDPSALERRLRCADDHDRRVGKKRVARLMRAANLRGLHPRRFVTTTIGDPVADRALDHVDRHFAAEGPDRLWVADITYIPTWAGFLYLAVVLDVWSRRIVGWAIEPHLKTELVLSALNMALMQRRPQGVIHHSDRGCQYTSYAFGKRCQEAGVMPSMGSTGDAYDNAMAESFFATLEREVLDRRRFQSQAEARLAIFQWLEGWYNPHRRHSALGYLSPINYERRQLQQSA